MYRASQTGHIGGSDRPLFLLPGYGSGSPQFWGYSFDGMMWIQPASGLPASAGSLGIGSPVYKSGLWAAITGDSAPMYSYDGIKWYKSSLAINDASFVRQVGSIWLLVASGGKIYKSTDGINYAGPYLPPLDTAYPNVITDIAYGGGVYVATGYYFDVANGYNRAKIWSSTDGVTWISRGTGGGGTKHNAVVYSGSKFVAAGEDYILWTSTNGTTWNVETSPTQVIRRLKYLNSKFIAHSNAGATAGVFSSSNGTSWSGSPAYAGDSVAFGAGVYVAAGGSFMYSSDAISWTNISIPLAVDQVLQVAFANGIFTAVGVKFGGSNTYYSLYSTNGTSWTATILPIPNSPGTYDQIAHSFPA